MTEETRPRSLARTLLLAAAFGAAVGLAGVYGIVGLKRNGTAGADPECAKAVQIARKIAPLVHGALPKRLMRPIALMREALLEALEHDTAELPTTRPANAGPRKPRAGAMADRTRKRA